MIKKISQLEELPKEFYNEDLFSSDKKEDQKRKKEQTLFEVSYETGDVLNQVAVDEKNYYTSYNVTLSGLGQMLGTDKMWELLSTIVNGGLSVVSGYFTIGKKGTSARNERITNHKYYPDNRNSPDGQGAGYTISCYSPFNMQNKFTQHGETEFHNNVVLCCNDSNSTKKEYPVLHVCGTSVFDNVIYGTAYRAQWGDLAETYSSDAEYSPGTLVMFGGDKEITIAKEKVNAVVTSNPGIVLDGKNENIAEFPIKVALTGKVPIRIRGPVKKFDNIVLSKTDPGVGVVYNYSNINEIIGKALEDNDDPNEKLVLCVTQLKFT